MFENNAVTTLLGIKYPLFQGGMAWVADAGLAAAVTNAGGLGIIAAMNSNSQQIKEQIRKARTLTDGVFGVNIMLMSPFAGEVARAVIEEKVPVVTTGAGSPAKYMKDWLAAGIRVIPVVPSVAYAKMMERSGACAVIAEGSEAGGHIGETTTMCLIPQVCDAVKIPVIAAGGIADGRGAAAAFMLGASGLQLGTRFLLCKECGAHENYKAQVKSASDIQTMVTGRKFGHPVRALKSKLTRAYAELEKSPDATAEALEQMTAGALRKAVQTGDLESGCFMAGQCAGLMSDELTASEIITGIFAEAESLLRGGSKCLR